MNDRGSGRIKVFANHAKKLEHEEFGVVIKEVANAIVGLIEAASHQDTCLVGVPDPTSIAGKRGFVNQTQFMRTGQSIESKCTLQEILSVATQIAKHTSSLCNTCKLAFSKTNSPERHFVQPAKDVANAMAILVKEIKRLDSNFTDGNRLSTANSTRPLIEAVGNLYQFASSPEFASVPANMSEEEQKAQMAIFASEKQIIAGSCEMIQSAKSLAVKPRDSPTWQALANSSKSISGSIKELVSSILDKAPGQRDYDDAIKALDGHIRELDQASLAAINRNLALRKGKYIKKFTEQMNDNAVQISQKLSEVQEALKSQAERFNHCITSLVFYFELMAENEGSNLGSSKQQVLIFYQTKAVAENAQQQLFAASSVVTRRMYCASTNSARRSCTIAPCDSTWSSCTSPPGVSGWLTLPPPRGSPSKVKSASDVTCVNAMTQKLLLGHTHEKRFTASATSVPTETNPSKEKAISRATFLARTTMAAEVDEVHTHSEDATGAENYGISNTRSQSPGRKWRQPRISFYVPVVTRKSLADKGYSNNRLVDLLNRMEPISCYFPKCNHCGKHHAR